MAFSIPVQQQLFATGSSYNMQSSNSSQVMFTDSNQIQQFAASNSSQFSDSNQISKSSELIVNSKCNM